MLINIISIIGLGLIPTVLSYIFYIGGLSHGVEVSKAGIICSSEIVVSVMISCIFFKEVILGYKVKFQEIDTAYVIAKAMLDHNL